MSAHTPGPWFTEGRLVIDYKSQAVTIVNLAMGDEQAHSTARLIAAAPDMLETLESLAAQCDVIAALPTCGERDFIAGLAKVMRKTAAIAKATGGE